jgi:hypothetical protein
MPLVNQGNAVGMSRLSMNRLNSRIDSRTRTSQQGFKFEKRVFAGRSCLTPGPRITGTEMSPTWVLPMCFRKMFRMASNSSSNNKRRRFSRRVEDSTVSSTAGSRCQKSSRNFVEGRLDFSAITSALRQTSQFMVFRNGPLAGPLLKESS